MRALALGATLLLVASSHAPGQAPPGTASSERSVLFVGNSLTYANDMPGMVAALARDAGIAVRVVTIAFPDYSLQDHWERGPARAVVSGSHWDVVVLQQGPSALEESRALLLDYTRRFSELIRTSGGTPALYMVWPTADRRQDFARSSESYRLAAAAVHGMLLPVGDGWQAAWRHDSTAALFAADGLHPSVAGSYLAALVILSRLTGRSPLGLPPALVVNAGASLGLPAPLVHTLQAAAAEALAGTSGGD